MPDRIFPLYELYDKNRRQLINFEYLADSELDADKDGDVEYKEYDRVPTVEPDCGPESDSFLDELEQRQSFLRPTQPRPVTRNELFTLLTAAYGETETTRPVPSAGQKYPLELYLLVVNGDDIKPGAYHYNIRSQSLERLHDRTYDEFLVANWPHIEPDYEISAMVVITTIPNRSTAKYGERGYLFSVIEAGAVLQNLQLTAQHLEIGSRPYAGFDRQTVDTELGLPPGEIIVTTLALAEHTSQE